MTNPMQAPAATNTQMPSASTNGRQEDVRQSHDLAADFDGLQHRLVTQPVIEQSKRILMGHFGIDPRHRLRRLNALVVSHQPQK